MQVLESFENIILLGGVVILESFENIALWRGFCPILFVNSMSYDLVSLLVVIVQCSFVVMTGFS